MAHKWEAYVPSGTTQVDQLVSDPSRRCTQCGVVQQRETETAWMRVTGYKWRPLAGRCVPVHSMQLENN
mgnify:CR=1 FL=1